MSEEFKIQADAQSVMVVKTVEERLTEAEAVQRKMYDLLTSNMATLSALSNALALATTPPIPGVEGSEDEPVAIQAVVIDERVRTFGLPESLTVESAGYDLRAFPRGERHWVDVDGDGKITKKGFDDDAPLDSITIEPGQQVMVSTGLRVWIDKAGWAGFMFARSGTGSKGLVLGNGTGVIDSDYQGPLKMCLWNRSDKPITIFAGDRVAQLVIMPVLTHYQLQVVDEFKAETERGNNGFGSTGVK